MISFDQVVKRLFIHDKWCNSATEAEKKQNWLENRLGNMVKEEGDAEDLNAAAEVVRYESKYHEVYESYKWHNHNVSDTDTDPFRKRSIIKWTSFEQEQIKRCVNVFGSDAWWLARLITNFWLTW